ncbi:MAG: 2-oxo acid dehydrogenase subunit E2 [Actinobacteria bacterium]|nr:2-oxo acid dehydrogenase subunit E2 [Actinomycetota bacterium]
MTADGTTRVTPTRVQQIVAQRMAHSRASVPDFTLRATVDMEAVAALRAEAKAAGDGPVPSYNDVIVKACAVALREHPRLNGSYVDKEFVLHGRVNVGIAVAAPDVLMVPVILDADRKSLVDIAAEARALADRVRTGSVRPADIADGTFTISNLGMFGIEDFEAVINEPQAAILAVGRVAEAPAVRDGSVVACLQTRLSLSCDHRIVNGADGAAFLMRVRELLEDREVS